MTEFVVRLQESFDRLGAGDINGFRDLFADDAQWRGVPGSGWEGETPT
jgi:ketosteroid isomerase-like protein